MSSVKGRMQDLLREFSPLKDGTSSGDRNKNSYGSPFKNKTSNLETPISNIKKGYSTLTSPNYKTKEEGYYLTTVSSGSSFNNFGTTMTSPNNAYEDIHEKLNNLRVNKSNYNDGVLQNYAQKTEESTTLDSNIFSTTKQSERKKLNGRFYSLQFPNNQNKNMKFKNKIQKEINFMSTYLAAESKNFGANKPIVSLDKPELEFKETNLYFSPVNRQRNLITKGVFKNYNNEQTLNHNHFNQVKAALQKEKNEKYFDNKVNKGKDDDIESFFKDFRKEKESLLSKYSKKKK